MHIYVFTLVMRPVSELENQLNTLNKHLVCTSTVTRYS